MQKEEVYTEVLFEEVQGVAGHLGIITLNRPQVLNALNQSMINAMHARLKQWADADHIKGVVIRAAAGRAFCAGGDLRFTYEKYKLHQTSVSDFFHDEYQLNRFIFHFPKPYIAFLDGITMGGGVGISIHGSHRIATEHLLFAMPETAIGFYPDVGGTYFLPRLPNFMGFYLGLTGARLSSDDCVFLGLANQKVNREVLPQLLQVLLDNPFGDDPKETVTQLIAQFKTAIQPSTLMERQAELARIFSQPTMESILEKLTYTKDNFLTDIKNMLNTKSPTSLKVTLQALQMSEALDFDACMRQEYRLSCHFLAAHDFFEGIRALIIDKDQKPQWQPATLAGVTQAQVAQYFAKVTPELA